ALRDDRLVGEAARRLALDWLALYQDDPSRLREAAWRIAARPDQPPEAYQRASTLAASASALAPGDEGILKTVAIAQYRAGQYPEAAATLARSAQHNNDEPADLAFLAMAQYRLGNADEARRTLARLREAMKAPFRSDDTQAGRFLAEAEALIDPPAA